MTPDAIRLLRLHHYYDRSAGPFRSLSSATDGDDVFAAIRLAGESFASQRTADYLHVRRELETRMRTLFAAIGGQPRRERPHYFTVGQCAWLLDWYADGCELSAPLSGFDPATVSFTFGDSFPAMRLQDGRSYRGRVYTLAELPSVIAEYGFPQEWNPDGHAGPDRYIEAQVWDDVSIERLRGC